MCSIFLLKLLGCCNLKARLKVAHMPSASKIQFPEPNHWPDVVRSLGKFARNVFVAMPCAGIDGCGSALRAMGVQFRANNIMDIEGRYAPYLTKHLGQKVHAHKIHGDVTQLNFGEVERPVDTLCSGPPCPPWAGNGSHSGPMDERSDIFIAVLNLGIALIKCGDLQCLVLENARGILNKQKGPDCSFMDRLLQFLREHVREFDWNVCILNATDYSLSQQRCRVFLRGMRATIGSVPEPLPPFGERSLEEFLAKGLPSVDWSTLTKTMTENLKTGVTAMQTMLDKGEVNKDDILVFPLDRAENKVYKRKFTVNCCPTLTTVNKYLFVASMDLHLPEKKRRAFRFLHPSETCLGCVCGSWLFFNLIF